MLNFFFPTHFKITDNTLVIGEEWKIGLKEARSIILLSMWKETSKMGKMHSPQHQMVLEGS